MTHTNAIITQVSGNQFGIRFENARIRQGRQNAVVRKLSGVFGDIDTFEIVDDDAFEREFEKVCTLEDMFAGKDFETDTEKSLEHKQGDR